MNQFQLINRRCSLQKWSDSPHFTQLDTLRINWLVDEKSGVNLRELGMCGQAYYPKYPTGDWARP